MNIIDWLMDLGIMSFNNLPETGLGYLFWRLISILIKPLTIMTKLDNLRLFLRGGEIE